MFAAKGGPASPQRDPAHRPPGLAALGVPRASPPPGNARTRPPPGGPVPPAARAPAQPAADVDVVAVHAAPPLPEPPGVDFVKPQLRPYIKFLQRFSSQNQGCQIFLKQYTKMGIVCIRYGHKNTKLI
jgi:hypothetical protein